MRTITALIITSLFTLLFTMQNCSPTEPKPSNGVDTTTQNFTFETFEFGDGFSSSYFKDVWIFDENNIWAVGYLATDSVSNANIMRWNGDKWFVDSYVGHSSGINGIWAIDSSNIYFANGAVLIYKDGLFTQENFQNLAFTNGQGVDKLWGSSANNIWGVGPGGTIVHFDGNEWKKIDFDSQWNFYDITGDLNTGEIYAVARKRGFISVIVKLGTTPEIIFNAEESKFPFHFATIELVDNENIYIAGVDIGLFNLVTEEAIVIDDLPLGYNISTITSTSKNDIYFIGDDIGEGILKKKLVHYNGKRFKYFDLPDRNNVIYGGSHSIKNFAIAVEFSHNKAFLTKIKRN